MDRLTRHIWGSLAGVAVGDSLGFPSHDLSTEEIRRRFGGPLCKLAPAFDDDIRHAGKAAGEITDDTILSLVTVHAILATHGRLTMESMADALKEWAAANSIWQHSNMFGPSTKRALARLLAGEDPWRVGCTGDWASDGASCGAPMRVAPVGLIHPGRIDSAIETAVEATLVTHGTQVGIAAACAQAAGIAEALTPEADVLSVVTAALEGARRGEQLGRAKGRVVPAPCVADRIELAVSLAIHAKDPFEAGELIQRYIGTYLPAAEALPTAIGLFVAAKGDPYSAMVAGATVGGDTDTISSMAGALCGALRGIEAIPADWYQAVEDVNNLQLESLARQLAAIAVELGA
ncbi:MAG: ADP-ribosylglycohydrolase family protein [Chloroflexi bacterium]|nr:ADP-ribosylglycohydrolase family protein [Chloroflexota bacterium]